MTITTTPVGPAALDDTLDQLLKTLDVTDLLHAVVTEMNALYPDNVLQNGALIVQVHPTALTVQHPEWYYATTTLACSTTGTNLPDVLIDIIRALRAGLLVPLRIQDDPTL